jgi:DNA-binding IclR family transcriptional regulator
LSIARLSTIEHAVRIVELIRDAGEPLTTQDLIARSGLSPARVRNVLWTLAREGWLSRLESGPRAAWGIGAGLAEVWKKYIDAGLASAKQKHRDALADLRSLRTVEEPGTRLVERARGNRRGKRQ